MWFALQSYIQSEAACLPVLTFLSFRTYTRDNRNAAWPSDIRHHGPKLSGFMEPCPWKCREIQSCLLSHSRKRPRRSTGGKQCIICWKPHIKPARAEEVNIFYVVICLSQHKIKKYPFYSMDMTLSLCSALHTDVLKDKQQLKNPTVSRRSVRWAKCTFP